MSHVDALLALLLLPFALQGWRRGLCREGCGLLGIVGGLIAAAAFAPAAAAPLQAAGVSEVMSLPIALAVVLLAAMVVARVMGAALAYAVRALLLGGVDRIAGVAFGALKGAAALGVVLILLQRFAPSPSMQIAIEGSVLAPTLIRVASGALEIGREIRAALTGVRA